MSRDNKIALIAIASVLLLGFSAWLWHRHRVQERMAAEEAWAAEEERIEDLRAHYAIEDRRREEREAREARVRESQRREAEARDRKARQEARRQSAADLEMGEAEYFVRERIKRILKSPSSATFGPGFWQGSTVRDRVSRTASGDFVVTGWVDAKNAFGVEMRNHFSVKVRSSGGSWIYVELLSWDG